MPDTKITALTALTAADPANDMMPIVDVSDTSMAASGTTKRISINNILACSPSATLASATITGNLTVDTNTLFVDSANNRVGIGTASPATLCEMRTSGATDALRVYMNGAGTANIIAAKSFLSPFGEVDRFTVAGNGVCTWSNVGDVFGTAMTLNSTGLGVGGSPDTGLFTVGSTGITSATTPAIRVISNKATFVITSDGATNTAGTTINYSWANGGQGPLIFRNNSIANVMTLDASGNVGVGVTPSGTGGCLQLKSGITFPATQVASSDANTLDDYEEGTFTPTVRGGGTPGTTTYTTQIGRYTKVGRLVTVSVSLAWTNVVGGTGGLQFGGLPFTSANTTGSYDGISIAYVSNIASTAGTVLYGLVEFGSTVVTMTQTPTGGGTYGLVTLDTAGEIAFTATYTA